MILKLTPEQMNNTLIELYKHTQNSWNSILEALSKLENIDYYKEIAIKAKNELEDYANKLN